MTKPYCGKCQGCCVAESCRCDCHAGVSTDPGAVTQYVSCEFCGRPKSNTWHTPPVCHGIHTCRGLLFDRAKAAESALTAMTTRVEAAEAELDSWKLEARSLAADVVRCWEHGRLGSRDHAMYNAAKRIKDSSDGAHVARDQTTTPVEQSRSVAQCDAQCGSAGSGGEVSKDVIVDGKPDGAPGNPGGSQDGVAPTAQQPGHLSTGDPPPEPAPAGFAVTHPGCSVCGKTDPLPMFDYQRRAWLHGSCAPQPAAAPKVLPVEEFVTRAEWVILWREFADNFGGDRPLCGAHWTWIADRLEQKGEPR